MDRYKVSGEELRSLYDPKTPLARIFMDIERELQAENRVVCGYIVNGMSLREKEEARFSSLPLEQVETLEYLSQSEDSLVVDVLGGWLEALPELSRASEKLALRIQAGQKEGLIKAVHDLVENCQFLIESLESIRQLKGPEGDPWNFAGLASRLKRSLSEAVRHLEKRDFFLLAEVIEYDLTDGLEDWRRALDGLLRSERADETNQQRQSEKDRAVGGGETPA